MFRVIGRKYDAEIEGENTRKARLVQFPRRAPSVLHTLAFSTNVEKIYFPVVEQRRRE